MAEEGDVEIGTPPQSLSISINIPHDGLASKGGRQSPLSDISVEERSGDVGAADGGVVTQIGAVRRGSFKNLDDHAGLVDPLGEGGEYGENAQKEDDLKIGTIRGGCWV
jgi:hypothetical protein